MINNKDKIIFIAVNYGTSDLIMNYTESIHNILDKNQTKIIIVDNYFSFEEREKALQICDNLKIDIIESDNIGYGNGLETGLSYALKKYNDISFYVLSNIDVVFKKFDYKKTNFPCAYIPKIQMNSKIKDQVFLTNFQKKFLWLHKIYFDNKTTYLLKIAFFKLLRLVPSKPWAMHGSCFIVDFKSDKIKQPIFNKSTFLYSEELEVGSYLESKNIPLLKSNIVIKHLGGVSTKKSFSDLDSKISTFKSSFNNWYERWK